MVGGLLTPCAVAVIWATPTGPGVHICGTLNESQLPAHASPLAATVTTAVLLDWKDTGSVIAVLVEVKTLAVNDWFVPISMDRFGVGVMAMLAGTAKFVVLTALLLLHPTRPVARRIERATANPTKPDLPMHPPRPHARPRGKHAF